MNFDVTSKGLVLPKGFYKKKNALLVRMLLLSSAAILVSGCVAQQSALQLNSDSTSPTTSSPASINLTPQTNGAQTPLQLSNNIPTKAPRPIAAVTQTQNSAQIIAPTQQTQVAAAQPTQDVTGNTGASLQTVAGSQATQITPVQPSTTTALAIAEPKAETTPTGNVIATAVADANNTPVPKPAALQPAQTGNLEVASLSPTVEAAPVANNLTPKEVKKQNFFERLFAPTPQKIVSTKTKKALTRTPRPGKNIETASLGNRTPGFAKAKPAVRSNTKIITKKTSTSKSGASDLPGVKSNNEIFGLKNEAPKSKTTRVASVGSFGKLSPNGLRVQHSKVQVACLKQDVLRILKQVERRYGKKPIITSGYRSPKGNRRAGGARNSQHIFCKAVDIQVEGVSKWNLAKYLRTIPGRGGVGTYCRTKSVHIDIGSVRNWHHPCRKSSKRKRKKKV